MLAVADTITILNLLISLIGGAGSIGLLIWGIITYKNECKRAKCNKLRSHLLELRYCLQQLNNIIKKGTFAILSQELTSNLFYKYDKDILLALLTANPMDKRTSRLEPIIYAILKRNKDVQYLIKISNRIQLLLDEIKYSLPIYEALLECLFNLLMIDKKEQAGIDRIMFLFKSTRVLNQLTFQLSEHKVSKLTKELFTTIFYQALTDDKFPTASENSSNNKTKHLRLQKLIIELLDNYILFDNDKLLNISAKQIKKHSKQDKDHKDTVINYWNSIKKDFAENTQESIFSKLTLLLDSEDFVQNQASE